MLVAAVLAGTIADAGQTALAAWRGKLGWALSLATAAETFGLVVLPAVVFAFALAPLFDRKPVKQFLARVPVLLAGGESDPHVAVGHVLACAALAGGAWLGVVAGRAIGHHVSASVAASATTLATLGSLVVTTLSAATVGPRLAIAFSKLERAPDFAPELERRCATVLSATILAAVGSRLVPHAIVPALTGAIIGAAVEPWFGFIARATSGRGARLLVLAAVVFAALAFPAFSRVPPTVRLVVMARSVLGGSLVASVRAVVDRDHDGASPVMGGGDCNDHDPTIYPGAPDLAGDGIDQNCSGADAKPFAPVRQAPYARPADLPTRPNIVMVQLDAQRPDHLGFAGYPRKTSPNLDRFRQHATWFRHAYSPAPSTRFAMSAVFTGEDVDRIPQKRSSIDFELLGTATFAARLGELGYDRVGYTISYVMHHIKGVGAGFRIWETPWPVDDWQAAEPTAATKTTDAALRYLAQTPEDGSKPYLLFLHYRCTHDPYSADPRFAFGREPVDLYDSAAAYCDEEVGRLFDRMRARKDDASTVTVVFSDHGELFGEHGFEYHGETLFEPDVRTVLLVRAPGLHVNAVETAVSIVDLFPTVLDLAGAPPRPDDRAFSLLPFLAEGDRAQTTMRPLYLSADLTRGAVRHQARAVLLGHFKLIHDVSAGTKELLDLSDDPDERTSLSTVLPAKRAELVELLESWEGTLTH